MKDENAIVGIWEVVWALNQEGKTMSASDTHLIFSQISFSKEKIVMTYRQPAPDGRTSADADYKLNADANPKTIDLAPTAAPENDKGKTLLGIYELHGDMLKMAINFPGKERPKAFGGTDRIWAAEFRRKQ